MSYKEHKHCPECGSRDNRAVYVKQDDDGKVYQDSYCWGCDTYFDPEKTNDLDGDVPEDYEVRRSDMELSESDLLKIEKVLGEEIRGWADRMISKEACQRYKVRTKFDQEGRVSLRYYPSTYQGELVGFHVRNDKVKQARKLDKEAQGLPFFPIGKCNKSCELFGQSLFPKGGKFLVITGGEEDAMVVWQSLRNKSKGYETAVVSPTIGETAAHKQILENFEYINSFEKIVVMMDNDKAGKRAAESISKLFSYGKVAVAELPQKDPCEVLKCGGGDNPSERRANGEKLIREAFWNSMPKKPSQVLTVDDIVEKAMKAPTMGLSFPWASATKATLGIRRGEVHIVGAAPKIGKTEYQHQLIKHMTDVHNETVAVMSLEENPVKTLKKVAGKYAGKQFTKPPEVGGYTTQELRSAVEHLRGKIEFYSSEGVRDYEEVLETIRYWASKGIWFFIIDPLTALVAEHSASEANDILNNFMSKATSMCMELQISMFMFSHVNPAKSGLSHDQGGDVLSSQFTGSRAMEKWAHYGWGIQRDRTAKDEMERNTARVTLLFDREFGEYCEYYAYYDKIVNDWSEVVPPEEDEDVSDLSDEPF